MCRTGRPASRPCCRRRRSTSRYAAISRIRVFTPASPTSWRSRSCSTSSIRESLNAWRTSRAPSLGSGSRSASAFFPGGAGALSAVMPIAIAFSRGVIDSIRIERVVDHLPSAFRSHDSVTLLVIGRTMDNERKHLALAERGGIETVHLDVAVPVGLPAGLDLGHHGGGVRDVEHGKVPHA